MPIFSPLAPFFRPPLIGRSHAERAAQKVKTLGDVDRLIDSELARQPARPAEASAQLLIVAAKLQGRESTRALGESLASRTHDRNKEAYADALVLAREHYRDKERAKRIGLMGAVPGALFGGVGALPFVNAALRGRRATERLRTLQPGSKAVLYLGEDEPDADKPPNLQAAQGKDEEGGRLYRLGRLDGARRRFAAAHRDLTRDVPPLDQDWPNVSRAWHAEVVNQRGLAEHHLARTYAAQGETKHSQAWGQRAQKTFAELLDGPHASLPFPLTQNAAGYNAAASLAFGQRPKEASRALRSCLATSVQNLAQASEEDNEALRDDLMGTAWAIVRRDPSDASRANDDFDPDFANLVNVDEGRMETLHRWCVEALDDQALAPSTEATERQAAAARHLAGLDLIFAEPR